MTARPDFDALRAKRNAEVERVTREIATEHGFDLSQVWSSHDPGACYCSCGTEENLCEHDFRGWREFDDGRGGETFCSRCGTGAMSHSMRVGM